MRHLVVVLVLFAAQLAAAETRRVAVVVGNNAGNSERAPLRYAEIDAGKMSRVLVELGGVEQTDLFLLQGKDLATLEDTLRRAKDKIAAYQQTGVYRVVVIFYYSGHSDGVALELGRERFTFAALRRWLKDTSADVRVGFVDSCKSGALLQTKGGTPGPAFQIRLTDDLSSSGEALLTSSAADEDALESKEIGGSFFTHHLVSGLRGAADTSGDARVTLSEAYQYAYKHTISTSGATVAGPQHPAYDYRLSGQGELILTELAQPTAALTLPDGFDRALVIDVARDQVIAELGRGARAQLAVSPGRYGVRAWKGDQVLEGRIVVGVKEVRAVGWNELRAVTLKTSRSKGDVLVVAPEPTESASLAVSAALGTRVAIADDIGPAPGVRIGVRSSSVTGLSLSLDVSSGKELDTRETTGFVWGGYRAGFQQARRLRGWVGVEVGGGFVYQSGGSGTGGVGVGAVLGLSVALTSSIAVGLDVQIPGMLLEVDQRTQLMPMPAGWFGVVVTP